MNYRYRYSHENDAGGLVTTLGLLVTTSGFIGFLSIVLLKYILYEYGSLYNNIFLIASVTCTRCYLFFTNKSLRAHETTCLLLFVLNDKDLLDFFNVFLLVGIALIREYLNLWPPIIKELTSCMIGLLYLLMGWFTAGRVLVIYNFALVPLLELVVVIAMIRVMIGLSRNRWEDVD